MKKEIIQSECCISGGGPAGMMLGYLLARAGVSVTVVEKWPDFLRDFRGDTIHPSTMQTLSQIGLLDEFLQLPHQKVSELTGFFTNQPIKIADFSQLPVRCPFLVFVPQWDFLNFLGQKAKTYSSFTLLMNCEAKEFVEQDGDNFVVRAFSSDKEYEIRSKLVVAADGRNSRLRSLVDLPSKTLSAPMDVLWFRISRKDSDPDSPFGRFGAGHLIVMLYRKDYWQCGFVIKKGSFELVKSRGLEQFQQDLRNLVPFVDERVKEITDLEDLKLLSVRLDRLQRWYRKGFLCIGDAAHAMSPVGGVGINLAIQDAVAAANFLVPAFKNHNINEATLKKIQQRRMLPTAITQRLQVLVQNNLFSRTLFADAKLPAPLAVRLINFFPCLQRFTARVIGMGIRPETISKNVLDHLR